MYRIMILLNYFSFSFTFRMLDEGGMEIHLTARYWCIINEIF